MKILCVIPSRIGSTRLPRKPLLPIKGKPMIQRVYENAKRCSAITDVVVATDSYEIKALIDAEGGTAVMTPEEIATGSDRVAFIAKQYSDVDVVINLQGDEPFINSSMLHCLVLPYLKGENPDMATLAYPLDWEKEYNNPGVVKVILNQKGNAIYFSRSPIPYLRNRVDVPVYHHIGLYAFSWDFLMVYGNLKQTPLEEAEALEQLRAIENGYNIRVSITSQRTLEINTHEEWEAAQVFESCVEA